MAGVPLPREHYERKFWTHVEKTETCWLWTGMKTPTGYASFYAGRLYPYGSDGKTYAHRYAYTNLVGMIPDGMDIDHLCKVRHCVNPDHLEAVTHRVNVLRGDTVAALNAAKTDCPKGHPLDGVEANGRHRYCTTCEPRLGHYGTRTHCKRGHPFDELNTYYFPDGSGRGCRTCRKEAGRRRKMKRAAAVTRGVA